MKKREDKYETQFATADDMVASEIPAGTPYHTVPGYMEVNVFMSFLKNVMWLAVGIAIAVALQLTLGISTEAAIGAVALPFILYALIKGIRSRPDAMAISDDTVWLFTDVLYDRNSKTFGFDETYEIPIGDIKKAWNFQLFTLAFKVPKEIGVKLRQSLLMRVGKYYQHNPVRIGEAKRLLFRR